MREFAQANPVNGRRQPEKPLPFQFLHDLPSDILLGLIADEHPQTMP